MLVNTMKKTEAENQTVILCECVNAVIMQERVRIESPNKKYGLRTLEGATLCEDIYDAIENLAEGYFKILMGGHWGVMDLLGKVVFECRATTIYYIANGRVICAMDDDVYSVELK